MSQPMRSSVPGMDLPDLAELPLPTSVSLFPETLAWKVVLAIVLLMFLGGLWLAYRRHVRRRWRRQAMALAREARNNGGIGDWFVLIKRVSLVHLPRERVAALSDGALLDQLSGLDESTRTALIQGHYSRQSQLSERMSESLARAFEQWLQELPDAR